MSGTVEAINKLLELARQSLAETKPDSDSFLTSVANYLDELEVWRKDFTERENPSQVTEDEKQAIAELNETHQRLLRRANEYRESLMSEMGSAQKKAKALRVYVDRFPARITITGKRKG